MKADNATKGAKLQILTNEAEGVPVIQQQRKM